MVAKTENIAGTIVSPTMPLRDSYIESLESLMKWISLASGQDRYVDDVIDATNVQLAQYKILREHCDTLKDSPGCTYRTYEAMARFNCPECGKKTLRFGDWRIFETLVDHCCDPNGVSPLRPTFVCIQEDCKAFQKGYWSVEELDWYGYWDMKYTHTKCSRIFSKNTYWSCRHENYFYNRNGVYIGPNWKSKTVKIWYDYTGNKGYRAKQVFKKIASKIREKAAK